MSRTSPSLALDWNRSRSRHRACKYGGRLAQGGKAGLLRYGLLLLIVVTSLAARRSVTAPPRPTIEDDFTPRGARELAADAVYSKTKHYPDDPGGLTPQWPADVLDLGFCRRGALPFRTEMRVLTNVYGPALVAPPQTHPGDVVFSLSPDRRHYWLTAFVVESRRPAGTPHGLYRAGDCRVRCRWPPRKPYDPMFPEYPNKLPTRGPPM